MAPEGWRVLTVDQIQADTERAIAIGPFGSRLKADRYVASGVPVIRGNNISDTRALVGDFVYVDEDTADELRSSNVFPGDLVFPHRGAIGEVGIVPPNDASRFLLSTSLMKLTCNHELVDPLYVFYFFRSAEGRHQLLKNASTVGTPGIGQPLTSLRAIPLPVPSITEQRTIAHILLTLDDKIELNRRMNETLEAIARALFKSWFVDLDPVRAKVEGRDPGLPGDVADLFPDSFESSGLGEIPRAWGIASIGDEFHVTMGQSPPGETYNQARVGLPFYQGSTDFGFRFPGRRVYCTAPTRNADAGDTLVSVRAPVGDINMAAEDCAIGRGVAAVRHKTGARSYTYQLICSLKDVFTGFEAEGTVFGSIGKNDFNAVPVIMASMEVVRAFERYTATLDERIACNESQIAILTALRDTLLPRLISGELRVKDGERAVAGLPV